MATLKNFNDTEIKRQVITSIRTSCKTLIEKYLDALLNTQVDATGERFPTKKESTKKQYRAKGWNEDEWLRRTGKATQLKSQHIADGISIRPKDPDNILKYVEKSGEWFLLNKKISEEIIETIKGDLLK